MGRGPNCLDNLRDKMSSEQTIQVIKKTQRYFLLTRIEP